jgi:hypothetical protein
MGDQRLHSFASIFVATPRTFIRVAHNGLMLVAVVENRRCKLHIVGQCLFRAASIAMTPVADKCAHCSWLISYSAKRLMWYYHWLPLVTHLQQFRNNRSRQLAGTCSRYSTAESLGMQRLRTANTRRLAYASATSEGLVVVFQ